MKLTTKDLRTLIDTTKEIDSLIFKMLEQCKIYRKYGFLTLDRDLKSQIGGMQHYLGYIRDAIVTAGDLNYSITWGGML